MFEGNKLDIIREAAKTVKNQGELAVYRKILDTANPDTFTESELTVIQYCGRECKRQRSGELSVYWMLDAWKFARDVWGSTYWEDRPIGKVIPLTIDLIKAFGMLVEPSKNLKGIRKDRVGIQDGKTFIEKAPPDRVIPQLEALLWSYYQGLLFSTRDYGWGIEHSTSHLLSERAEDEFYYQYENIHPFMDGNGRTGKIIYNFLLGKLDNPIMPPNFFGEEITHK